MEMDTLRERARELGRMLGQGEEYRALRLADLEQTVAAALERNEEPPAALRDEYDRLFSELQASPVYQGLVAAQSNFDKVLGQVNDEILAGIQAGAQSRIILPS